MVALPALPPATYFELLAKALLLQVGLGHLPPADNLPLADDLLVDTVLLLGKIEILEYKSHPNTGPNTEYF